MTAIPAGVAGRDARRPTGAAGAADRRAGLVWRLALGSGALALAGLPLLGWGRPAPWAAPLLAVAVALSELAVVHLSLGRQRWSFSCTDSVIVAALALSAGGWVVVALGLGMCAAQLIRRQGRLKLVFNTAQFVAAGATGVAVTGLAAGHGASPFAAAGIGLVGFWLVNHVLVSIAVILTSTARPRQVLLASAPLSLLHTAANGSIGLVGGWLALHAPAGLLGLLLPLALLWHSYDQETRRAAEVRLFAELARGQEQVGTRSVDLSAGVVVTTAARLFGGADIELVVFGLEGPVLYRGDETAPPARRRVGPDVTAEPWVNRALGHAGVITGVEDGRPFALAGIGPAGAPNGVLIARRPAGSAPLGRRDTVLVRLLVQQAETWLSAADLAASRDAAVSRAAVADEAARALGDIGAETVPALSVLRESAARLARMAAAPVAAGGQVRDIVSELHEVERAVASLLGAIALAAEPDLLGDLGTGPEDLTTAGPNAAGVAGAAGVADVAGRPDSELCLDLSRAEGSARDGGGPGGPERRSGLGSGGHLPGRRSDWTSSGTL